MVALASSLSTDCSVRVAHSYILQTPGIIRLIILFYMMSLNYDRNHQTGV